MGLLGSGLSLYLPWPLEALSLQRLTYRLILLLALATAQRTQTLQAISLPNLRQIIHGYAIEIPKLIKTSRPGTFQPLLELPRFPNNPPLCVPTTLESYVAATAPLRGSEEQLFITYTNPYRAASKDTVSRWLRTTLVLCGIDRRFPAHSTRYAASSKALKKGVSLDKIRKAACWSKES